MIIMPSCRPQLNLEESSTNLKGALSAIPGAFCVPGELLSQDQVPIQGQTFFEKANVDDNVRYSKV